VNTVEPSHAPIESPWQDESSPSWRSPFVPMTAFHRWLVVTLLGAYLLWVGLHDLTHLTYSTTASAWLFMALAVNISLLLLPVVFYQSSYGWFHPLVFNIFLTLIVHLRRTPLYLVGMPWHAALPGWSANELDRLVVYELFLRAFGLGLCYLGFWLSPRLGLPQFRFDAPRHLERKVVVTVLCAIGVFLVYMQTRGGLISHILSWGYGRRTELAGDAYWGFVIQMGITACLSWLALDRRAHRQPLFWGCAVSSLAIIFFASGSRGTLVYFLVMALLVWCLRERKISFTKPVLVVMLGLLLLGLLGNFRTSTFRGEVNWGALAGGSSTGESAVVTALREVSARSSEGSAVYPILAKVPAEVDFIHGRSYLAVLTLPIPRALWSEKPGMVGGQVGATFFNSSAGIPPGAIGEAYWNFGLPGVTLIFLLFGGFYRWLADTFRHYADEPAAIILYVVTLFRFAEPSTPTLVSWLIVLVLSFLFLRLAGAMRLGGTDR
jgi:hypothetical protein